MTKVTITLAQGRTHVRRIINHLEALRWQLAGIAHELPESSAEQVRLEDLDDTPNPVTDLRATIACVLEDYLRPAIQDLQDVLASTSEAGDSGEEG